MPEACTYATRFLAWGGLSLYLLPLGSRRPLDEDLRDGGPPVRANRNRRAATAPTTLPVPDTLDHFRGHVQRVGGERRRAPMVQRLLRRKAVDAARLLGRPVRLIDATGRICFPQRHGAHCLVQRHGQQTRYLPPVREAPLLGPAGVVVSLDSAFSANAAAGNVQGRSAAAIKPDGERKARHRLLPRIPKASPPLRCVRARDSWYACGPVFALAQELGWS